MSIFSENDGNGKPPAEVRIGRNVLWGLCQKIKDDKGVRAPFIMYLLLKRKFGGHHYLERQEIVRAMREFGWTKYRSYRAINRGLDYGYWFEDDHGYICILGWRKMYRVLGIRRAGRMIHVPINRIATVAGLSQLITVNLVEGEGKLDDLARPLGVARSTMTQHLQDAGVTIRAVHEYAFFRDVTPDDRIPGTHPHKELVCTNAVGGGGIPIILNRLQYEQLWDDAHNNGCAPKWPATPARTRWRIGSQLQKAALYDH